MKKLYIIPLVFVLFYTSCADLDIDPLGEALADSWYSTPQELEMALNGLYRHNFFFEDGDSWTDDETQRDNASVSYLNVRSTLSSGFKKDNWKNAYKAIARANLIIENSKNAQGDISAALLSQYVGEAKFFRACQYSYLISRWGDVPLHLVPFEGDIDKLAENTVREDKNVILEAIYSDFDDAATSLPVNGKGRVSKGAAYAMKARIALYNSQWDIVRDAAKACIDSGGYQLYPDYRELFLDNGDKSDEIVFSLPRSFELDVLVGNESKTSEAKNFMRRSISRNALGWGVYNPSWDLLASYLCTDGLPIDESPLFDPRNPFKNRDPRCSETIVEFGTMHLGYIYQPHPDSNKVYKAEVDSAVANWDIRSYSEHASHNGLLQRKGIDDTWAGPVYAADNDRIIIRYADVMLMYAEALIENNEELATARSMINQVRARAYGVDEGATDQYPAVTANTDDELRKAVRVERRMELALEGLRLMDLIRWSSVVEPNRKVADRALVGPACGMLTVNKWISKSGEPNATRSGAIYDDLIDKGLWFWAEIPSIDDDGLADFSSMLSNGYCRELYTRAFESPKFYLWPLPLNEKTTHPHWPTNGY